MATADLPQSIPYQPLRVSVERYHDLIRAGAFSEHDEVELLDGVVTEKMFKNPRHALATRKIDLALSKLIVHLVPEAWHVRNQEPVTILNSEPEPDIAIVRGNLDDYANRHPGVGEIDLVIEVADTSLVTDRYKAGIYAAAEIPTYWLVNLSDGTIEVYDSPVSGGEASRYAGSQVYAEDGTLPVSVAGIEIGHISVRNLLP